MIRKTQLSESTANRRKFPVYVLILLVAVALAAAIWHRHNPLATRAAAYAQDVATVSAATYVTLRTLNAVLSTAQEIEVSGSALVVSGAAQPLKLLEPVDDTIERIAGFVFALMIVTGVLAFSLGPLGAVGAGMIALAGSLWLVERAFGSRAVLAALSQRLIWYGLFFLVALPLAFALSALLSDVLTGDVLARHQAVVAEISAVAETAPAPGENGWWGGFRNSVGEIDRYREIAGNIWSRADELIGSYLSILAVFVFRVFLLPALIAGGLFVLIRFFAHQDRPEAD